MCRKLPAILTNFFGLEYSYLKICEIPLKQTIEICTNEFFKESETVEGLSKIGFKELLSLATKDSHFHFDGTLFKQIDGVTMGSPLGPTLANAFLVYHKKKSGLNVVH